MSAKVVAGVVMAAFLLLAAVSPAAATSPRFDAGAGFPTVDNFGDLTLNGTQQLTTASIPPFVVIDDSGALAGWHVTLQIPNFQNGSGGDCATGATASLDATGIAMNAAVVAPADGLTSMTGVTSADGTDFTTATTIVDAAAGDGAGRYTVSPQILKLIVPASTIAGAYCTQATIAIASGP